MTNLLAEKLGDDFSNFPALWEITVFYAVAKNHIYKVKKTSDRNRNFLKLKLELEILSMVKGFFELLDKMIYCGIHNLQSLLS